MSYYIQKMSAYVQKQRGYSQTGYELVVSVSFDSKQFQKIKKSECPMAASMAQIKNVVLDACGVRGIPSYSQPSMIQRFPRAKNGLITLQLYFDLSEFEARRLNVDIEEYFPRVAVDMQTTLDETQNDGHLFAKTAVSSRMGH